MLSTYARSATISGGLTPRPDARYGSGKTGRRRLGYNARRCRSAAEARTMRATDHVRARGGLPSPVRQPVLHIEAGGGSATTALTNVMSYLGFYVVAVVAISIVRWMGRELHAARDAAVERGRLLASEEERSRQHRQLHDSALQTTCASFRVV